MIERRNIAIEQLTEPDIETRAEKSADGQRKIILYSALFNTQSRLITEKINGEIRSFYETISGEALNESDVSEVRYVINHDPSQLIARTSANNLIVRVTQRGLLAEAVVPDEANSTTVQNDTIKNIAQRNYRENSFAFKVAPGGDSWERRNGVLHRTINRIATVVDVSTVLMGAYQADVLFTRSLDFDIDSLKDPEVLEPPVYDKRTVDMNHMFLQHKAKRF